MVHPPPGESGGKMREPVILPTRGPRRTPTRPRPIPAESTGGLASDCWRLSGSSPTVPRRRTGTPLVVHRREVCRPQAIAVPCRGVADRLTAGSVVGDRAEPPRGAGGRCASRLRGLCPGRTGVRIAPRWPCGQGAFRVSTDSGAGQRHGAMARGNGDGRGHPSGPGTRDRPAPLGAVLQGDPGGRWG